MRSARARYAAAMSVLPLVFLATSCDLDFGGKKDKRDHKSQSAGGSGAASSGGAGSGASGSTGGASAPVKVLTADQLKAALLAPADLPNGWSTKVGSPSAPGKLKAEPAACQAIVDLLSGDPDAKPVATGDAILGNTAAPATKYNQAIEQYSGVAEKLIADVTKATEKGSPCHEVTAKSGKIAVVYTTTRSDKAPKLGDATIYLDVKLSSPGKPDDFETVRVHVVRSGDLLVQFAGVAKGGTPDWLPDAIVKSQVDKVLAAQTK
ncbi:hypothetical protein [Embleya sp. NPDC001921]